ncbi:MAG TPA: DUF3467 domain-containing protein [Gemmataceae bacterium]|nr:DUF3467 domain-containing protein [Gemmataceae bacterium]
MADETKTSAGEAQQAAQPAQAQAPQFTVDAAGLLSTYTNWYRVTGTPEELVIDFGLNPQMGQAPSEPIKLSTRLVMNFYTAKRLLNALQFAVQRHESFFGVVEVDVQKRVRGFPQTGIRPMGQ